MKGIHFDGTTMRYRTDLPEPVRTAGEALIRVRYAGVCRTDREIARGYMRFTGIPGHEFIGTVVETDDPSLVGASVTGDINLACHDCPTCAQGRYHHCPTRTTLGIFRKDGVMAEYATLPARNLYVLPEGLSPVHGAFIEPLAAALEIVSVRPFAPELSVLVIGDGILSYLIVGVLSLRGNAVTLIGKHDDKMRIFGERYPRISLRSHRDGVGDDRSRFPVVGGIGHAGRVFAGARPYRTARDAVRQEHLRRGAHGRLQPRRGGRDHRDRHPLRPVRAGDRASRAGARRSAPLRRGRDLPRGGGARPVGPVRYV